MLVGKYFLFPRISGLCVVDERLFGGSVCSDFQAFGLYTLRYLHSFACQFLLFELKAKFDLTANPPRLEFSRPPLLICLHLPLSPRLSISTTKTKKTSKARDL